MEAIYYSLAMLTAGISAAMGSLALLVGLKQKDKKTYFLFGCMGWLMVMFILAPPAGFLLADVKTYESQHLIKRLFIFSYYAVFPWFIYYFSGRPGKWFPAIASAITIVSYFSLFAAYIPVELPIWIYFAALLLGLNLVYGIAGSLWMLHSNQREGKWLALAMAFYAILYLTALTNDLYFEFTGQHLFVVLKYLPMHLNALALMLIVGLRLQDMAIQKIVLERVIDAQRSRWKAFLEKTPLLILEVSRDGQVVSANEFAVTRFGLSTVSQLVGKNWFDFFVSDSERETARSSFQTGHHPATMPPVRGHFRIHANDAILVSWVSFASSADTDGSGMLLLVGQDLTSHESALNEVEKLKLEIEKEQLAPFYTTVANTSTEIIGSSKALGYTLQKAQQVAATNATVLLEGETGVGKELFADFIHSHSSRKDKPFIKVNCSAMPSELIETELFGHEKGAFTSAASARVGRFELADGGTILLDEIGELPLSVQPKLLRVLQQGEFERVGGQKTIRVDVRIIAATNRDLNREVVDGKFRSDLLYRLNVFPISIPALRSRKEDLDLLVGHFVRIKSEKYKKAFQQISKADVKRIHEYPWPGNIRELINLIERSVIQSEGDTLRLQWLNHGLEPDSNSTTSLEDIEREHIVKILNECGWKINGNNGAAEKLDMNPNTLRSRMKKLNIVREQNLSNS